MPVLYTSATLMNGSPFKGSRIVFQLEDPFHFPCTKSDDILCSLYFQCGFVLMESPGPT